MVTFARNPVPETSGYGDGRFLLHMLAQRNAAANTPQEVVAPLEQQALSMPRQLVDPSIFQGENYAPDPMANAEINPLATPATGGRTVAAAMPTPMARPGVSNTPMARPDPRRRGGDEVRTDVNVVMQNMRDMLGQNASAATAIDNIDGNPAPAGEAATDEGSWWGTAARIGGMAALIAAILSGRGRSASGVADAVPGRNVVPSDPGLTGEIMGSPRLSGPSSVSPSPSQIETDILSVTPNELPGPQRSVATRPNDVPVAQGRPQSVNPDVMQGSPRPSGAIANNSIRYRGQVYSIDPQGNVLDRNGDIVRGTTANEVKRRASQRGQ